MGTISNKLEKIIYEVVFQLSSFMVSYARDSSSFIYLSCDRRPLLMVFETDTLTFRPILTE